MNKKPIGPKLHGALDYGVAALELAAPSLLKLNKKASTISYALAATKSIINSLTDHPLSLKPLIPFRVHGQLDAALLPAVLVAPWATKAVKQPIAKAYFITLFSLALTTVLFTDFRANESTDATDLV